ESISSLRIPRVAAASALWFRRSRNSACCKKIRTSEPEPRVLFELVGDLFDAGLDAGFVLVAARGSRDPDRADHVLADRNRPRAARGGEAGQVLRAHLRILLQAFFHLARRNAEGARGVGLLEAVLHGVRAGAVAADLDDHLAVAADHGGGHAVTVRGA